MLVHKPDGTTVFYDGKKCTPMGSFMHPAPATADLPSHNEISNPAHYHEGRKHSPDEVIEDWNLGFRLGNVVKYVSRAGRKGPALTDLRKAADYLAKEIASLEAKERAP